METTIILRQTSCRWNVVDSVKWRETSAVSRVLSGVLSLVEQFTFLQYDRRWNILTKSIMLLLLVALLLLLSVVLLFFKGILMLLMQWKHTKFYCCWLVVDCSFCVDFSVVVAVVVVFNCCCGCGAGGLWCYFWCCFCCCWYCCCCFIQRCYYALVL